MTPYIPKNISQILDLLENNGASDVLVVGGYVRDRILGIPSKDVDIEVYGLSYAQIRDILSPFFSVSLVGQAFGVLKVGRDVDVTLPRRESKAGLGHRGFDVEWIPTLAPLEAFARRDFTINAIGLRRDGTFCDPYNGLGDLKHKILRATTPAFKEDPLRVLRGVQFAARFGFTTDSQTLQYCREVLSEFPTLSKERVYEEWKKWALKGEYPEFGLLFLRNSGWIEAFPELFSLVDHSFSFQGSHTKEDLWSHTLTVCKEAANLVRKHSEELTADDITKVMFSALTHGMVMSVFFNGKESKHKKGDCAVSTKIVCEFFEKMRTPYRILNSIERLVSEYITDVQVVSVSSIRRLANRLVPANIKLWGILRKAFLLSLMQGDTRVSSQVELEKTELLVKKARELHLLESAPLPVIRGRDLCALGVKPGYQMGKILKLAFEAQLDNLFSTTAEGIEYVKTSGWLEM